MNKLSVRLKSYSANLKNGDRLNSIISITNVTDKEVVINGDNTVFVDIPINDFFDVVYDKTYNDGNNYFHFEGIVDGYYRFKILNSYMSPYQSFKLHLYSDIKDVTEDVKINYKVYLKDYLNEISVDSDDINLRK